MTEFTLQELHDEIEADPQALDYKEANGDWKGDQVIADLINDPTNGGTIQRQLISPQEIIEQITIEDWNSAAVSDADRAYVQLLSSLEIISAVQDGTEVRANLLDIFGAGTTTRDNLIATVQRQGSRAEVLWSENTTVSASNVGHAANL